MVDNNPLISIVMPVYNSSKFLARSIESVLRQSYENFEFIILDDASTDDSWNIIMEYAKLDSRIRPYTIPFVDGPKAARDCAIRRSIGEWIISIDSDDTIEPDYINKLWNRHLETNADFVGSKMVLVDENGNLLRNRNTIPDSNFDYSSVYSGVEAMLRVLSYWQFGAGGALWNRFVMSNIGSEDTYSDYADEYDTRVHLLNCKIVSFVEATYFYTQNTQSCTRKVTIHSLTYQLFNEIKLKDFFDKQYGIDCALSVYFQNRIIKSYESNLTGLFILCIKNKIKLPQEFIRLLERAYSIYRSLLIRERFLSVQYHRILWLIIRRISCS